jgi:hypothetical protein
MESKRAGSFVSHSRPAPFQQRTNTSCYLAIPTHGFTVVLSVFWGTPPAKPLDCKIRLKSSGAHLSRPALLRAGGEPRLSRAALCFLPGDIVQMPSLCPVTVLPFVVLVYFSRSWATKNPAYVAVSRVGKSYGSYDRITCLPKVYRGCYTRTYAISGPPIDSG